MTKLTQDRLIRAAIVLIFLAALLVGTLTAGRYVSRGTYADTNYMLLSSILIAGLTFYAILGIVRPRSR